LDWQGRPLVSNFGELSATEVTSSIVRWIEHSTGRSMERPHERLVDLPQIKPVDALARKPSFCSGCPHNISTKVPDGSVALGGIGCHGMAGMMPERHTLGATPMGAEGANWIGQSPFTSREHVFQNLGDGTYYHSGILALRAALSAGVNITYKILANDAVAMTGGQAVEGNVTAPAIAKQVWAEGVAHIAVVTDEPGKYAKKSFPKGVTVHHRSELDEIQRSFREIRGVTVIVYDQACAAEKRRLRKRTELVDPPKRLIINELVCEGCGDCNVQSNCISLEPVATEFGRKRTIDQSSCNKDYSCLDGYCPSFVTVYGGERRASAGEKAVKVTSVEAGDARSAARSVIVALPQVSPRTERRHSSILVTGVGGAGIVTLGAVLAMAAHLEGKAVSVLNVLGMAQKNGAVTSHVRISNVHDEVLATRIGPGECDLIIGTDPIVTGSPESIGTISRNRTRIVMDEHIQPTSDFATTPDLSFDVVPIKRRLARAGGDEALYSVEATKWAKEIFGDIIMSNMMMLGVACELGQLPVGAEALHRAIELNGQSIDDNQLAFDVGRLAVHDPDRIVQLARTGTAEVADLELERQSRVAERSLAEIVSLRSDFLVGYQNSALATKYRDTVAEVERRERSVIGADSDDLSKAVARYYFKLLAYKDEYEVARLYTDGSFRKQLDREISGHYRIELNLSPQMWNSRDPRTGRAKKRTFGRWILPVLRVLALGRKIRGTKLDILGRSAHRRLERELIREYERTIDEIVNSLNAGNHGLAIEIAEYPESIRGYDVVKEESIRATMEQVEALLVAFREAAADVA
jgi:indolepyruvate ferredoxin oxidoreductase